MAGETGSRSSSRRLRSASRLEKTRAPVRTSATTMPNGTCWRIRLSCSSFWRTRRVSRSAIVWMRRSNRAASRLRPETDRERTVAAAASQTPGTPASVGAGRGRAGHVREAVMQAAKKMVPAASLPVVRSGLRDRSAARHAIATRPADASMGPSDGSTPDPAVTSRRWPATHSPSAMMDAAGRRRLTSRPAMARPAATAAIESASDSSAPAPISTGSTRWAKSIASM